MTVKSKIQNNTLVMEAFSVTAQMVVKNEDRFTWYAVVAVLPYVEKFIITDTGSNDNTWQILQSIKDKKIILKRSRESVVEVRREQLKQTKTPWFMLVDGDEIWPKKELIKLLQLTKELSKGKLAVVNRTRNCVGDVWHYLPEEAGQYQFGQRRGHFNIRLMRTLPYEIEGTYPWEEYRLAGESVNSMTKRLVFSPAWYLHCSHLQRTSAVVVTAGRRQKVIENGVELPKNQLPEVLLKTPSVPVANPLAKRSLGYEVLARSLSPFKWLKRTVHG